jgi:membrane-associated phospholipid phosphatase
MLRTFVIVERQDPFRLAIDTAILPGLGVLVLLAAALGGRLLDRPRLESAAIAFLQLTLFTMLAVLLSYVLAGRAGPLWDSRFAAWDAALGLHWPAVWSVLDRSNALVWLLGLAYHSLIPQMIVAVVALSSRGKLDELRMTVNAAILSGFATVLLSGVLPGSGNLVDPGAYQHLWPSVAWSQGELIAGLRDGSMRVLDLGAMEGIVTFPSYHAALAAIFVWSFRAVPGLALPGALWAGLTIVATPLVGGHYAVDVIAGLALVPVCIPAAQYLVRLRLAPSHGTQPQQPGFAPRPRARQSQTAWT